MKLTHRVEVDAIGNRVQAPKGEEPNRIGVSIEIRLEGGRGEPIIGSLDAVLRGTRETVAAALDRRPY